MMRLTGEQPDHREGAEAKAPAAEGGDHEHRTPARAVAPVPPAGLEPATRRLEGDRSVQLSYGGKTSGRPDLNRRPSAPKADALPGCATPRSSKECTDPVAVGSHQVAFRDLAEHECAPQRPGEARDIGDLHLPREVIPLRWQ